ncbi:MAG TPA: cation:proton antiporter [Gemmatimonadales bacterium]|nr:cation:proton antiporter [Gemmatimonadales bacterium]
MHSLELVVALAAAVVAMDLLARRVATPRPVVLAAGGLLLGLLWSVVPLPGFTIEPDLVLALLLPPLLAAGAFRVPLGAFRASLGAITLLAVGLVLATMVAVAAVAHAVVPGLAWSAALVLGAIVAPPDAVAATTVAARMGLRNRLVTILEGEGLVNDATALVAYELAVVALVTGHVSGTAVALAAVRDAPLGVLVGLVVGWLTAAIRRRVDDPMIETAVSLLVPYVAYLAALRVGGSGILAVVAFGFYIRRRATEIGAPATRLVSRTVWSAVDFVTGGLVFVLVGIELGRVVARGLRPALVGETALVAATAIAVRLVWMYVVPQATRLLPGTRDHPRPSWGELTVLGWAGMRGVVSLALAIALPGATAAGTPFAARGDVVVLALGVVLATLLGQGLTLAPLIRLLGVGDPGAAAREEHAARLAAVAAGRARLAQLAAERAVSDADRAALLLRLGEDLGLAAGDGRARAAALPGGEDGIRLLAAALAAERAVVLRRRDAGRLDERSATRLEAALDLDEIALRGAAGELTGE